MGNQNGSRNQEPDLLGPSEIAVAPGCFIRPIADNPQATIYSTNFSVSKAQVKSREKQLKSAKKKSEKRGGNTVTNCRHTTSILAQKQGKFIVFPKSVGGQGKRYQVKSANPYSNKIYYVISQQDSMPNGPRSN